MNNEVVEIVDQAGPYLIAALGAYGSAVLNRAEDAAVDATANLGHRILQTVWRSRAGRGASELETVVREAADEPEGPDAMAALRQQIRRALREDAQLREELTQLLPRDSVTSVSASGTRAVAAQNISGMAITGDGATVHKR